MARFLLNSYLILPEDISHLQTDLQKKKTCVTASPLISWIESEGQFQWDLKMRYPQFQSI